MRTRVTLPLILASALVAGFFIPQVVSPQKVQAQGYSGALPNVTAAAGTSLRLPYTAGAVTQGGAVQAITADGTGLLATGSMTSCAAPAYSACNFVYWTSGTALAITTTASTAFAPGNVVVAFVTTTSNDINVITPASRAPWNAAQTQRPSDSLIGGAYWVPPGNCWYSVATGTLTSPTFGAAPGVTALGLNVVGASSVPVMQVATTNAASVSVNTISCVINPPSTVGVTGRGVNLTDAVVFYGIQQAGGVNATQASVAASGTFNGTTVFDKITMPTPGSAETPSTVTPVRADAGNLGYTPAAASFNSLVTTAGAFFTQKFTPATAFGLTTDLTIYHINFTVLCNTTQATTINVAGVMVHFTS
jgi:hypothetical protein